MIMADILKIFLLVVGAQLVLIAYWLAAEALFPHFVTRARKRYGAHPIRVVVLGLAVGLPGAAIAFSLLQAGGAPAKGAGFGLAAAVAGAGLLGSAGLCRRIGEGLPSPADAAQPWRRVLRGAAVLVTTFLLPFLGWFGVLPLVILSGVGATLDAAWGLRRARAARAGARLEGAAT